MDMNFDNELLFTGGRDGSIFRTTLSEVDQGVPITPTSIDGIDQQGSDIYDKIYHFS